MRWVFSSVCTTSAILFSRFAEDFVQSNGSAHRGRERVHPVRDPGETEGVLRFLDPRQQRDNHHGGRSQGRLLGHRSGEK